MMANFGRVLGRGLAFLVPAALGVVSLVYSGTLQQPPAAKEVNRAAVPVRVITVEPVAIVPRISGYGTVGPARQWRAVSRIEGEVAELQDGLAAGVLVAKGDLLIRIDDTDLRLTLAQTNAQLAAADVKDATLAASQQLAEADLELMRAELVRQQQLVEQGVATTASLDAVKRRELTAVTKVTEIDNQRQLAKAERAVQMAQKASVERSLEFAALRAPYDLRITNVSASVGQYASRGQVLLEGEGTDAAEVAAQFPMGGIGPLLRLAGNGTTVMDLKARVRLSAPGHDVVWKAVVDRVGDAIDSRTQSATVVVRVDDPLSEAVAGQRPPLRRNMFVEVVLMAPETEALVVPAEAVRDGTGLVVSENGTLEKRTLVTGYAVGDLAVVSEGLAPGDQLVITSPTIAVPGMEVKAVEDAARKAALLAEATGKPQPAGSAQGEGTGQGSGSGSGSGQGKGKSAGEVEK